MAQPLLVEPLPSEEAHNRPLPEAATPSRHRWVFHRFGGLDQVALMTARDLRELEHLDQKLWVALACPTKGLELDGRTLELLDIDHDGRVRVPEILAALRWCGVRLRDLGQLLPGGDGAAARRHRRRHARGRAAARAPPGSILARLGQGTADAISIADVADTAQRLRRRPRSTATASSRRRRPPGPGRGSCVAEDIVACLGGALDRERQARRRPGAARRVLRRGAARTSPGGDDGTRRRA